jgi:alpha-D-xyloside xylohydrolase
VIPMGPVKQYTAEPSDEPLTMVVYPGADGESHWYDDDGQSFDYRAGKSMSVVTRWTDAARTLSIRLAAGSNTIGLPRRLLVRVAGAEKSTEVRFTGREVEVTL